MLSTGGRQSFGEVWSFARYYLVAAILACADHFAERYLELLKESKIRGYMFEQQNYIPGAIVYAGRAYQGAGTEGGPGTKEQVAALEKKLGVER